MTAFLHRRLPVVALALLLAALVALVPVARDNHDAGVRAVGNADFAASPVHVDPGAPVHLDETRVTAALGDRPIVVGSYPASRGDRLLLCQRIADDLGSDLVVVYTGTSFPALCAGPDFPPPDATNLRGGLFGTPTDAWLFKLGGIAQLSSELRVQQDQRDRTVEIEELALAFDVAVSEDFDSGVPRRFVASADRASGRTLGDAVGLLGILAVSFVLGGLLLQALVIALVSRVAGRRRLQERRRALELELSRLAHFALKPREAATREGAAELYVEAVAVFEAARSSAELDVAEAAFARVVKAVTVQV